MHNPAILETLEAKPFCTIELMPISRRGMVVPITSHQPIRPVQFTAMAEVANRLIERFTANGRSFRRLAFQYICDQHTPDSCSLSLWVRLAYDIPGVPVGETGVPAFTLSRVFPGPLTSPDGLYRELSGHLNVAIAAAKPLQAPGEPRAS